VNKPTTIITRNSHGTTYFTCAIQNNKPIPATSTLSSSPGGCCLSLTLLVSEQRSSRNGHKDAIADLVRARMQKTKTPAEMRHEVYKLCGLDESRIAFYKQRGGIVFIEELVKKFMVSEDSDELQRGIDKAKDEIKSVRGMTREVKDLFATQ
jgi:hypothetical protein